MSEADEVAAAMPLLDEGETMDDARRIVRGLMPDESEQVIDNVAWPLYYRGRS